LTCSRYRVAAMSSARDSDDTDDGRGSPIRLSDVKAFNSSTSRSLLHSSSAPSSSSVFLTGRGSAAALPAASTDAGEAGRRTAGAASRSTEDIQKSVQDEQRRTLITANRTTTPQRQHQQQHSISFAPEVAIQSRPSVYSGRVETAAITSPEDMDETR